MKCLLIIVNDAKYFISHRLPIAKAALEKGYNVHVASAATPALDEIKALGFVCHRLPLNRGESNPFFELYSILATWFLLVKLKPDILHLVTLKPVLYGGIAARFAPVGGVVAAIAGMGSIFVSDSIRHQTIKLAMRFLFRFALGKKHLRAIFQNAVDRDEVVALTGISLEKTILIRGSGVSVSNYAVCPEPAGAIVVTFAGRLLRDKGVIEFIEAARVLHEKRVNAIFQLVGDVDPGNPTTLSSADLARLKGKGIVQVKGYVDNIAGVFAASNIVVLPSYREGLPKVLIEAAACGRSVVTTDVPGCRDAIEPGVTGFLVPVKDHIALAEAINNLISDSALRQSMGAQGRKLAEQEFTIESVVKAHLSVYEDLGGTP